MTKHTNFMRRALAVTLMYSTAVASHAALGADASVLEGIVVEGKSMPAIISTDVNRTDIPPAADSGAFLRSIPGVDAVRMGGHGLDPVIRGQQQDQLNIISDGAFLYGGCPNRMDPPAALTSLDSYDSVTVEKGFQSVSHGPGGSGGTVIFERKPPAVDDATPFIAKGGAGYNSNGGGANANVDLSMKVGEGYVRAQGTKSRAGNYKDGSGKTVRSGFNQWSGGMELGWTPGNGTELSLSADRDRTDNTLFAGASMDSPWGVSDSMRIKFAKELQGGAVKGYRFNGYTTRVDHLMDNYSLRSATMFMRTPTKSDTTGFKIEAEAMAGDVPMLIGVDYKKLDRNGVRYSGMNARNVNTVQSYVWPGVVSREIGVFSEGTMALDGASSVKVGVRYDNVHVTASKADLVATVSNAVSRSANQLYNLYYGYGFKTQNEHNVSGLVRYESKLDQDTTVYASAARSVRTANTTERTMASDNAMTASQRWVGNPNINPEAHYQLDVGANAKMAGADVSVSAYYDYVKDYIFRDVARGQAGILLSNTATIYRNIDATLMGVDLTADYTFDNAVAVNGSLSFVRGQNEDDNAALPQIPPMKLGMDVSYPMGDWLLGTRVTAALKQGRVDSSTATGSGRDVGKTAGWATADLYASTTVSDAFEVGLGVTNVFDKTYAYHLNKSNSFDTTETQVNEPGRSFYFRLTGQF